MDTKKMLKLLLTFVTLIQGKKLTSRTYTHNPVLFEDFSHLLDSIGLTVVTVFTPSRVRTGRYYVSLSISL